MLSFVVVAVVVKCTINQCVACAVAVATELSLGEKECVIGAVLVVVKGVAVDGAEDGKRAVGILPHQGVGKDEPLVGGSITAYHAGKRQDT